MAGTSGDDVFGRLRDRYEALSRSKKRVVAYILDQFTEVAFMPLRDLARAAGVSESLVVRLASDLGYQGWPELQHAIQAEAKRRLHLVEKLRHSQEMASDHEVLVRQVLEQDIENLRRLLNDNPVAALVETAQRIVDAERVYVVGARMASAPATWLALNLNQLVGNVELVLPWFLDGFERLNRAGPRDVVVAFSFKQYTTWTNQVVEHGCSRSVPVVAVSDSLVSFVAQKAVLCLRASTEGFSVARSHAAVLCLLHMLVCLVGALAGHEALEQLSELEGVYARYRLLAPVDEAGRAKGSGV